MAEIKEIPVGKINVGQHALRMGTHDGMLDALAGSIRRVGVIVPLVVVPDGDNFLLVAGHRRFAAAKKAELKTVPCIVRSASPAESTEVSFAENVFRQDLSPVEVAAGIKDVLAKETMTVPELAAAMHRSEHWVQQMVTMLSWPADVLEVVHNAKISVAAASNLAMVTADSYRGFLLTNALESGATARTTAAWLQAWRSMAPPEEAINSEPVAGRGSPTPALPQAPCISCNEVHRTDGMSMVLMCSSCINTIRGIGQSR